MDTKLEKKLQKFLELINKETGISSSFDHNHCVDMFMSICAESIPFDCEEIQIWLVSVGKLRPRDARAVKTMAEKFRDGRRVMRR